MGDDSEIPSPLPPEASFRLISSSNQLNVLLNHANSFLGTYCPNWKDRSSYILPKTFVGYQTENIHPFIANDTTSVKGDASNRLAISRASDDAEYVVFKALEELKNEQSLSPFIALHSLNVTPVLKELKSIFPKLESSKIGTFLEKGDLEYDFIVIGPKVGFVMIEVKSSSFTQSKHFSAKGRYLPEVYLRGLKHLDSTETLLELLKIVSKTVGFTGYDASSIRKVLFTPNLKRSRFDGWIDGLQDVDKEKIRSVIRSDVTLWFEEDMKNTETIENSPPIDRQPVPPLYDTLRRLLESDSRPLPPELFESFVPIMTVMASIVKSPSSTPNSPQFALDKSKFSEFDNQNSPVEALKIWNNDPRGMHRANDPIFSNITTKLDTNRSIFFTCEQARALSGSDRSDSAATGPFGSSGDRRLIIGTVGTGKTVLLQSKAMELMRKELSVVIFCTEHASEQYRRIFDANGFEGQYRLKLLSTLNGPLVQGGGAFKHSIRSKGVNIIRDQLEYLIAKIHHSPTAVAKFQLLRLFFALHHNDESNPVSCVSYSCLEEELTDMIQTRDNKLCAIIGKDNVFIDDTSEDTSCQTVIAIMICMYFEHRRDSKRTFWATVDPLMWRLTTKDPTGTSKGIHTCVACKEVLGWMTSIITNAPENVCLHVNLRSPIDIFRSIYYPTIERLLIERFRPYPGHQILGPVVTRISIGEFPDVFCAVGRLRFEIMPIFQRLANEDVSCNDISVIYQCATTGTRPGTNMIRGNLLDCWQKVKSTVDDGTIPRVIDCADVSSMEFPVVIFVSILPTNVDQRLKDAGAYRARSRCSWKLFEISGSYKV